MELQCHSQIAAMAQFYHYIPILRAFGFEFPIPSSKFSIYLNYMTIKKIICINSNILLHRERMPGNTLYKGFFPRMSISFHSVFRNYPHLEPAKNERCSWTTADTSDKKYPQHLQKALSDGHFCGVSQCSLSGRCNNPWGSSKAAAAQSSAQTLPFHALSARVSPLHCSANPPAHTSTMLLLLKIPFGHYMDGETLRNWRKLPLAISCVKLSPKVWDYSDPMGKQ